MGISKISDATSILMGDRLNLKIITVKVIRIRKDENYIFLTCGIIDDDVFGKYKRFTLKTFASSGQMHDFVDVKVGDYISFSNALRQVARISSNYTTQEYDLDFEFIFEKHSNFYGIYQHLENSTYSEFDKLLPGMSVKTVGKSVHDSKFREKYHVLTVTDINNMPIEAKYLFKLEVKKGQIVIMTGDIEKDGNTLVLDAKEGCIRS